MLAALAGALLVCSQGDVEYRALSGNVNCYEGHGAQDLELQTGVPCGTMKISACEDACSG